MIIGLISLATNTVGCLYFFCCVLTVLVLLLFNATYLSPVNLWVEDKRLKWFSFIHMATPNYFSGWKLVSFRTQCSEWKTQEWKNILCYILVKNKSLHLKNCALQQKGVDISCCVGIIAAFSSISLSSVPHALLYFCSTPARVGPPKLLNAALSVGP